MSRLVGSKFGTVMVLAVTLAASVGTAHSQASYPADNTAPNPYRTITDWAKFPDGRKWGSTAGISIDPKGNVWVLDRCGKNNCDGSDLSTVLEFDTSGKLLRQFGQGMILSPHGIYVDKDSNVWVTDSAKKGDKGLQIFKFSPEGKVLMTMGKPGVQESTPYTYTVPAALIVGKGGDLFVADAHSPRCDISRVIKYTPDGKFIKEWGHMGTGPGDTNCPHGFAIDSKGRLYVADRSNNRVEIYDQDGKYINAWKQFGRPSGIFIDKHDILYVADSESTDNHTHSASQGDDYGYNPGCGRGIRVGSVKDGKVIAYIPDPAPQATTSAAEGVAVDFDGNIYGAEVGPKDVKKYVKK